MHRNQTFLCHRNRMIKFTFCCKMKNKRSWYVIECLKIWSWFHFDLHDKLSTKTVKKVINAPIFFFSFYSKTWTLSFNFYGTKTFNLISMYLLCAIHLFRDFAMVFLVLSATLLDFLMWIFLCCYTSFTIFFLFVILIFTVIVSL